MKCPKCSADIQTQTLNCPNCGAPVAQPSTKNTQTIAQFILLKEFKGFSYGILGFVVGTLILTNATIIFPIRDPSTYEPNILIPLLLFFAFLFITFQFFISYRNYLFLKATGKIFCRFCRNISDVKSDFCVNCRIRVRPWWKNYCEEHEYYDYQRMQQAFSPAPVDPTTSSTLEIRSPYDNSTSNLSRQQYLQQLCPTCGQRVGYVSQYQKYYCHYCRQYLAE